MLSAGLHRRSLDHATRQRTEYTDENGCGRSSRRSIPLSFDFVPARRTSRAAYGSAPPQWPRPLLSREFLRERDACSLVGHFWDAFGKQCLLSYNDLAALFSSFWPLLGVLFLTLSHLRSHAG